MGPAEVKARARLAGAACGLCPLEKKGIAVPSGPIPAKHRLTVVGEGPGRREEIEGVPFVGQTGKFLDRLLLQEARVPRGETWVTNGALCRGESDDEKEAAAKCCAPRLLNELREKSPPRVPIATAGKLCTEAVIGLGKIFFVRGFVWRLPEIDTSEAQKKWLKTAQDKRAPAKLALDSLTGRHALVGRTVLPTLHPAFVLRSETWHPILRGDFRRIGRAVRGTLAQGGPLDDEGTHEVTTDVSRLKYLASEVALDVETTNTGSALTAKLLCVGLSDGVRAVVLWPWAKKMAAPLSKFLHTRKAVIGHNLIGFDKVVLEQHRVR